MNDSSTSCAAGAGPPRDLYYPIDCTHIDIGCVACGSCIKQCCKSTPLSELIRRHKKESPLCFDGSTIDDAYAECARAIEERVRSKMSLFDRNRHGDTDSFFTRDQRMGYQCTQCLKCFGTQGKSTMHITGSRTKCSGSDTNAIACRTTIFGTFCPAPLACTRRRIGAEIVPSPVSADADTETRRS